MAEALTIDAPAPATGVGIDAPAPADQDLASQIAPHQTITLAVDNMHCGGCMRTIESALGRHKDVEAARVNLSQRRVVIKATHAVEPEDLIAVLNDAGFSASQLADFTDTEADNATADLTRRLGISAFAAMNVMLLSVSVWSGGSGDMSPSVQSLFHWLSALIALPAIAYAGQPFFASARTAILSWHVNMDVPISLGVLLATALSLYRTIVGDEQIYFDAAIMLLTFLLLGRLLDQLMRQKAASAAQNLLKLRQASVRIVTNSGETRRVAINTVVPGMRVLTPAGERLAVDGRVYEGTSSVDRSIITGETLPHPVTTGDAVFAGAINLSQPLVIEVTAKEDQSLLCELANLMETAQQQRGRYVQIADRAARAYAPMVHLLAALTFLGWIMVGAGWQTALPIAISVLIITCPCALALAVPAVQIAAAARLMKNGIILKSGDALERLVDCDTIVFDKTGTLTFGALSLDNGNDIDDATLNDATSLAATSTHPYSLAIVAAARKRGLTIVPAKDVKEAPGFGLSTGDGNRQIRLGSPKWCGLGDDNTGNAVVFKPATGDPVHFRFEDRIKGDVPAVIKALKQNGYAVELLSGDAKVPVEAVARAAGIDISAHSVTPAQKVARLKQLQLEGHKVAMVGDGLNDAPSLKAAHVSLSPSSAAHISQAAADYVFQGDKLAPLVFTLAVAKNAHALVKQNFALAIGYNVIFVPLAMLGIVTPLIAAIAMSVSSISVTANAFRLSVHKMEL